MIIGTLILVQSSAHPLRKLVSEEIEDKAHLRETICDRLTRLRQIATKLGSHSHRICNASSSYVLITEYQFGNSGNQYVELTHALWMADQLNATLVIPKYMTPILKPFNLAILHSSFCFLQEHEYIALPTSSSNERVIFELESEDSFFFWKIFDGAPIDRPDRKPNKALPPLSKNIVHNISKHYLKVFACLWSSPRAAILDEALHIISKRMNNKLNYTAVHKRSMEGGCSKLLFEETTLDDFDPQQLPMNRSEWNNNLQQSHPICEFPMNFIKNTIELNLDKKSKKKQQHPIFIAWDGRGNIDEYLSSIPPAIFSSDIVSTSHSTLSDNQGKEWRKFVDMMVSMHGTLFILNPRSTFSWAIYIVRVMLDLKSVPVMKSKDIYCTRKSIYENRKNETIGYDGLWVSWTSVQEAMNEINNI